MSTTTIDDVAEQLRVLAGVARARNGRLEINWISRTQRPRWRMVFLDGRWYERESLGRLLDRRPSPERVPASRRQLTTEELWKLRDPNPWRLIPPLGSQNSWNNNNKSPQTPRR